MAASASDKAVRAWRFAALDTGINWDQAHHHREYYNGPLLRMTFDENEYQLEPGQQLREHLAARHLALADIDVVVLTHLHEDHLGGVRELLGSRILVSRANWRARNLGIFPFRRTPSLKGVLTKPEDGGRSTASPSGYCGATPSHDPQRAGRGQTQGATHGRRV